MNNKKTFDRIEQIKKEIISEKQLLKNKIKECKQYVKNNFPENYGLVFTKIDIDLCQHNRFMIYIDNNVSVEHKFISLQEANIKPLNLKYVTNLY